MKTTGSIFFTSVLLFLSACIYDPVETQADIVMETGGVIEIIIPAQSPDTEEKMETVRFFVFKDATISPKPELNELVDISEHYTGNENVSEFSAILEVSRKVTGTNYKMVVAIVNEPAEMTSRLEEISSYNELQNLQLDFTYFVNDNYTGLKNNKMLPMTGMVLTNKVFATRQEAKEDPAYLTLERAVARVNLYIQKEPGVNIDLGPETEIKLKNTYDKEYFIYHRNDSYQFGLIQTVTSGFQTNTWKPVTSGDRIVPDISDGRRLVCSFYTPERTCIADNNADKLVLSIDITSGSGQKRNGEVVIDRFLKDNEAGDIKAILRNNSYDITLTVERHSVTVLIEVRIMEWKVIEIPSEFD